jgi:hypothetical protein
MYFPPIGVSGEIRPLQDSVKIFHVGGILAYPPISSLSLWERVRVRGFSAFTAAQAE